MRTHKLLLAVAAFVAAGLSARADDRDAVQDLAFLGDDRPVLVRLNIEVDGVPFREHEASFLRKLFRHLDRDEDGFLSKDEAGRAPNRQIVARGRTYGYFFFQNGQFASLKDFDTQPFDGKVAIVEFVDYYRKENLRPLQLVAAPTGVPTTALNNAIYRHLDRDGDGKLSEAECAEAPRRLRKFDTDDDESISMQELSSSPFGQFYNGQPQQPSNQFVEPEEPVRLLAHYDRNKDKRLDRDEIRFDASLFGKLDADKDGFLVESELRGFFATRPDLELNVKLGKDQSVARADTRPDDLQLGKDLKARFGNAELHISEAGSRNPGYAQNFLRQFDAVDPQKTGKLSAKQLDNGRLRFFKLSMPFLDRNGDGDLSREEVVEYMSIVDAGARSWITITVQSGGQGLFQSMDADSDGRLSLREQRAIWSRLHDQDRNQDGAVARDELSRQVQVVVGLGRAVVQPSAMMNVRMVRPSNPNTPVPAARGPLWFRKMDSNNDGDVSRREFLGAVKEFTRIDKNGDGLISLEEAEALSTAKADARP